MPGSVYTIYCKYMALPVAKEKKKKWETEYREVENRAENKADEK